MPRPRKQIGTTPIAPAFDAQAFLNSPGITKKIVTYRPLPSSFLKAIRPTASCTFRKARSGCRAVPRRQGSDCGDAGPRRLPRRGCPCGAARTHGNRDAISTTTVLIVPKQQMIQLLHDEPEFSNRFIAFMLSRNIRIEEDLVDQLFNSSEKRLARTLMLLARYGMADKPHGVLPSFRKRCSRK